MKWRRIGMAVLKEWNNEQQIYKLKMDIDTTKTTNDVDRRIEAHTYTRTLAVPKLAHFSHSFSFSIHRSRSRCTPRVYEYEYKPISFWHTFDDSISLQFVHATFSKHTHTQEGRKKNL